ncbi:MAG: sugar phosphate isomerase/epimerase family protein [Clostridia bacterium]|nr:sugar phosphate isomerase/epimerase family protein [Clostridia bacterium]
MLNIPFKLGIITDEVTQDIFEANAFACRHGLDCIEIRSLNDRSPFDFFDSDIDQIMQAAQKYNLQICAVSAPLFKCDFNDIRTTETHIEKFEKCAIRANKMGAKYVRGFDFWESGVSLVERVEKFIKIAEICEKYDIICVLESDPAVHSSTPHKLAKLLKEINNQRIRALFDPGNEVWVTEKASTDAYEVLKPYIAHIHVKDADIIDGKPDAVKVGTGIVDYPALFKRLINDNYSGAVVLETHYRKNIELTEEQLKRPGGSVFSLGAYDASEESMVELKKIINKALEG